MNASKMMARMTTTNQKKNTIMPGTAYPATLLALATAASYPPPRNLFGPFFAANGDSPELPAHEPGVRSQTLGGSKFWMIGTYTAL